MCLSGCLLPIENNKTKPAALTVAAVYHHFRILNFSEPREKCTKFGAHYLSIKTSDEHFAWLILMGPSPPGLLHLLLLLLRLLLYCWWSSLHIPSRHSHISSRGSHALLRRWRAFFLWLSEFNFYL